MIVILLLCYLIDIIAIGYAIDNDILFVVLLFYYEMCIVDGTACAVSQAIVISMCKLRGESPFDSVPILDLGSI